MIPQEIAEQLQRIASMEDFATRSAELTDAWSRAGGGVETIEPVLRFIEQHPTIDFGMPGPSFISSRSSVERDSRKS